MRLPDRIALLLAAAAAVAVAFVQFNVVGRRAAESVQRPATPAQDDFSGLDHGLVTFSDEDEEPQIPASPMSTEARVAAAAERLAAARAAGDEAASEAADDADMLTADPALLL